MIKPLTQLSFFIALSIFSACKPAMESGPELPNIIFLLADDQRDNALGVFGHPWVKTPHIDDLVRQGVRFSNTYIAEPTCSPSRVAIFTGMHERINGIGFTSSYALTEEQWEDTYPALLRDAGYYTGFIGKFGVEYYTFRGRASGKFDFWRAHDGWTRFFPKESDAESCTPYHDAGRDIITHIMGESIEMFFDSLPGDRPFCLSVSFNVPHGSQTTSMHTGYTGWHSMTRPASENPRLIGHPVYDTLYRNTAFDIPEDCAGDAYKHIPRELMDQHNGRSKTYDYDYDPQTCREHHIRYYQTITGLDREVGRLLEILEKENLAENTVIIFASDHGLLMGEYGMGGKALLYDLSAKIPCFIYDPALPELMRGITLDQFVSSLDLTSTILDYAGIIPPAQMQGRSLVPLLNDPEIDWRKEIFLENLYTGRDTPFSEGVRQGKWKYIRMYDGKVNYREEDVDFYGRTPDFEQLFDLEADPGEYVNLIEEFEGTELLRVLRSKCRNLSHNLNQQRSDYKNTIKVEFRRTKN